MPDPDSSSAQRDLDEPRADGLPPLAPDAIEQDHGDEFDNIVPTSGYEMVRTVGLGGSAGSIPALQRFFAATPVDPGMAFVVVLHLPAEHESIMHEILGRNTAMPVVQATDEQKLEANNVYIIPPGKLLSVANGALRLTPLEPERGKRVAVDLFFRTLADTHGAHAAAIILSGADGDGALGIKRIKERGGLTIAQDPEEAEHPSMPRSAIDTGMVDWVLPVSEMPARLLEYKENGRRLKLPGEDGPQPASVPPTAADAEENALREVLMHLRTRTGRDFTYYKRATVVRRIARRMQVNALATVTEYLAFLRMHVGEAGALQQDLLISVTNFFRDREAFEALAAEIPKLFADKKPSDAVRVWTAGCATGEEAYSLAMLLLEQTGRMDAPPAIQVFATDLSDDAVVVARDAFYPLTIQADVSEERLRRFFTREPGGFRARRELREAVLFATHDLLKDAPFSKMDLFTCRNLLIYLTVEAQNRVFDVAHFSLRPGGRLFIGSSESPSEESGQWEVIDKKHRLYRQKPSARAGLPVPIGPSTLTRALAAQERARGGSLLLGHAFLQRPAAAHLRVEEDREGHKVSWEALHFKLLERFAPPSLIVTRDYDIVHVSENAGRFLHFSIGEPSVNLMKVVHPMLRVQLRTALFRAAQNNMPVEVFRVPVEIDKKQLAVDIRVAPAQEIAPDYLLVVFAARESAESQAVQARQEDEPTVRHLEREIEQLKRQLRETVEQYEAAAEEQKASTEELQAMNEELQSSAEELETSREELQSVNEELTTVNQEMKSKMDELSEANSDLANLMAANGVATIFLDRALNITRYTQTALSLFRLIPTDLGRPLIDVTHRLNYPELEGDARQVLTALLPVKREIEGEQGWYLAQLLPYRTMSDRIAGVVLTFTDITETRRATRALEDSEQRLRTLADAVPQIIWANDAQGNASYFNDRWYQYTGLTLEQSAGPGWQAVVHPDDEVASKELWNRAQGAGAVFDTEYRLRGADGVYRWFIGRNVPMLHADGRVTGWFGTATDIQELKDATVALRASEEQLRRAIEDAPIPVMMHAEDGQILQLSKTWTELSGYEARDIPTYQVWLERAFGARAEEMPVQMLQLFQGEVRRETAEVTVQTRGGDTRCWSFSASAPGTLRDGRRFIVTMAIDSTERTRAEEALRESQERLRLIVENAREYAIFALDPERRITSWNRGAEMILLYTAEEAIGQLGDIIFTPEDKAAHAPQQETQAAIRDGRAGDERWHLRKDGSRFWGSGVMMPMHDAQGRAVGFVKIFRDHTEQLRAKQALENSREELLKALNETDRARAQAEAAGRAKDHFLAVLSHELRTPLTPVMMATQILARRTDLPDPVRDALAMIRRNIQLESRFIDELLDITKIERGKLELDCAPMDMHEAVGQAVEVSKPEIEEKGQTLTVALQATAHRLNGDFSRLQQVVWNLLKNASKFSADNSEIRLQTRNLPGQIIIEVIDTGIGIEPEAIGRIFDPFTQADATISRKFGGLGLGLAIARASVIGHGGEIQVQSKGLGHGTTFSIFLPLLEGEEGK